jgi:hypothetical protein
MKPELIPAKQLLATISISRSSLHRTRNKHWQEGIHYQRLGTLVLYNLPLIRDWLANQSSPELHEQAIRQYLESLPSSQRRRRG